MDLTDIYRTFHPIIEEYTFFTSTPETFSRIGHMLGHKTSLNKLKKTEITSSIFSDHSGMKLEISNRRNPEKFTKQHTLEQPMSQRGNQKGNKKVS